MEKWLFQLKTVPFESYVWGNFKLQSNVSDANNGMNNEQIIFSGGPMATQSKHWKPLTHTHTYTRAHIPTNWRFLYLISTDFLRIYWNWQLDLAAWHCRCAVDHFCQTVRNSLFIFLCSIFTSVDLNCVWQSDSLKFPSFGEPSSVVQSTAAFFFFLYSRILDAHVHFTICRSRTGGTLWSEALSSRFSSRNWSLITYHYETNTYETQQMNFSSTLYKLWVCVCRIACLLCFVLSVCVRLCCTQNNLFYFFSKFILK